jgi:hypothetical protein
MMWRGLPGYSPVVVALTFRSATRADLKVGATSGSQEGADAEVGATS